VPREAEVQTAAGRWYLMRILPYRTIDNVIEGAVLTFVDITSPRALQDKLRENDARLRVALGSTSMVLSNQDAGLRYTWIHNPNPGFKTDEIIGKTDADLLPKQEAAALTALKRQVLESGTGIRQNVTTTIDGKTLVYDLTVEPLRDDAGAVVGIVCSSLDVTGRQEGERPAASQQEEEKP